MLGLLWMDDDKKTSFNEKVERALRHFAKKHDGKHPASIHVSKKMLNTEKVVGGVPVVPSPTVTAHHFYMVYDEAMQRELAAMF